MKVGTKSVHFGTHCFLLGHALSAPGYHEREER